MSQPNKSRFMITFEIAPRYENVTVKTMEGTLKKTLLESGYFTTTIRKLIHPTNLQMNCSVVYIFEPKSLEDAGAFEKNMMKKFLSSIDDYFEAPIKNQTLKYTYAIGELTLLEE